MLTLFAQHATEHTAGNGVDLPVLESWILMEGGEAWAPLPGRHTQAPGLLLAQTAVRRSLSPGDGSDIAAFSFPRWRLRRCGCLFPQVMAQTLRLPLSPECVALSTGGGVSGPLFPSPGRYSAQVHTVHACYGIRDTVSLYGVCRTYIINSAEPPAPATWGSPSVPEPMQCNVRGPRRPLPR